MTVNLDPADHPGRPTILLVHGAWHGAWCWDLLRPHLESLGYSTAAVELPSATAFRTMPTAGLHADTEVITERIDRIDGPVVLVVVPREVGDTRVTAGCGQVGGPPGGVCSDQATRRTPGRPSCPTVMRR